ncbi:MAG TPA: glycerophosphodiester phosphodiesterase [Candidatus Saccharimonadales bacterium]|jgi:glycerophosphoryl diester phosphodiesterase|nr:glycerophosphodiester phosphodiesterase [Candidatus Saccharimonadales bacterium]
MTRIIGHRGARGLAPENTIASIRAALTAGVDEVEVDIRVTKDGIPVLNHDPYINDANGGKLRDTLIHKHTLVELRSYRPDLATLDEAVVFVNRRVPMTLEVKPKVSVAEPVAALRLYLAKGWQGDDFLLASFSQRTLKKLHAELPGIEKVINEHFSGWWGAHRAQQVNAKRVLFNQFNMWSWFIRSMTRRGYRVTAFTLNNQRKAERWAKYGLYGIITDYPDRFIRQIETATKTTLTMPKQLQPPSTAPAKRQQTNKRRRNRRSK